MGKKDRQSGAHMSVLEAQKQQLVDAFHSLARSMRYAADQAEAMARVVEADPSLGAETKVAFQQRSAAELAKVLNTANPGMSAIAAAPISPASDDMMVHGQNGASKKRARASSGLDGEKKKRERKPKDPNAPKRPASAYILFQNDVRKVMAEKHPGLSYRDLLSEISKEWAGLEPSRKQVYQDEVDKGKAAYNVQKAAYDIAHKPQPAVGVAITLPPIVPPPPAVVTPSNDEESSVASSESSEESEDDDSEDDSDVDQQPAHKKHKSQPAPPPIASVKG